MLRQIKTRKNCFRYLKLMSPLNAAICTTISYTLWYYLKNNYLTLRSKVPWRSLRYATHRLMVMHPHTKYHWPIWKDKKVMSRTRKYYLTRALPMGAGRSTFSYLILNWRGLYVGSGGLPFCNVFPLLIVNRYVGFHFNAYHSLYNWANCIFFFRKKCK